MSDLVLTLLLLSLLIGVNINVVLVFPIKWFQVALIVSLSQAAAFVSVIVAIMGMTNSIVVQSYRTFIKHVFLMLFYQFMIRYYGRIFCATRTKFMAAEQSTFMIGFHQVVPMLL